MVVKQRLTAHEIDHLKVELGEVKLAKPVTDEQFTALKNDLHTLGFELLDDRKASIVTQIKSAVIQLIHGNDEDRNKKLSVLLSEKLGIDYNYLSALFSSVEGITLEKYVILQRIEKAKEFWCTMNLVLMKLQTNLVTAVCSIYHSSLKKQPA
jgi:YesN/AraC family two-component response regulator